MAFVEEQFPADISYGSAGGPEFSTDVVASVSGAEQRNSNWSQARARYNVAHGVKTQDQLAALIAFFRARRGRAVGFRFKDWLDYHMEDADFATGDGATRRFQLAKPYESGGVTHWRTINKPVIGTVTITVDGLMAGSSATVDYSTGMVEFTTPPANGAVLRASCEFDVPVRFDTDRLSARLEAYGVHSWLDIPLVEVRA